MSAGFNQLLEFEPVPRRVLLSLLLGVGALAVFAIMLTELAWWGRALAMTFVGSIVVSEYMQLCQTPNSLQRLPDGIWLAYPKLPPASAKEIKPTKYTLQRHFFAGNWSIGMLFRDSRGRKVTVWLLKSTCSDPEWRRLRVLLRWSDAGSGQDA